MLKELLLGYDFSALKTIAREHRLDIRGNKEAVVERLAQKLAQRDGIERAWAQTRPAERELIARIQRAGGAAHAAALKRILLKGRVVAATPSRGRHALYEPYQGNPDYSGKPVFEDVVAHLALLGLVLSRGVATLYKQVIAWEPGRELVIPDEVRLLLPEPPAGESGEGEPARIAPSSARALQRDLARYCGFVRRSGKLDVTTLGWLYKKDVAELVKALGWPVEAKTDEAHHPHLFFVRQMLRALKLIAAPLSDEASLGQNITFHLNESNSFWSRPPGERARLAFEAYRDTLYWNELRVPPTAYGYDHRRAAPPGIVTARGVVLAHIAQRGAGRWIDLDDLLDDIGAANYEFLFARTPRSFAGESYNYSWGSPYHQSNNAYGISYKDVHSEEEGWERIEGAIIRHIVAGPLHWLGLVDLGFEKAAGKRSEAGEARAYRLNPLGAWLLGLGAEVALAQEGGRVIAQPNFQVVAMEPIGEDVLMTLDEFAEFEGGDNAMTYTLTRESVYRGQRNGWSAARIVDWLAQVTQSPLPQNVRRTLEDWDALSQRILIRRNVVLLQADEAAALDELFADPALAPGLGRRVAGTVALPGGPLPAIRETLQAAGWAPLVTRADEQGAPGSVVADGEGNLQFFGHAPSIYAYGAVEPFAELLDAHHARLTPESIRAAVRNKLDVPQILERLQQVQRGEIPPALERRIKAWGNYYGDARLGTLTLVEFRDETARSEMLADPELTPYLTRFEAGARPLAIVRSGALETVKQLLAERGVEVSALG